MMRKIPFKPEFLERHIISFVDTPFLITRQLSAAW